MKLAYITTVPIEESDAQSIQVHAMSTAFAQELGDAFVLVSPRDKGSVSEKKFTWRPFVRFSSRIPRSIRYGLYICLSLRNIRAWKPTHIYTRDIGIACVYRLFGYTVTYEAHKPFETYIGRYLFSYIQRRISFVCISQALQDYLFGDIHAYHTLVAHDGVWSFEIQMQYTTHTLRSRYLNGYETKHIITYAGSSKHGKGADIFVALAATLPEYIFLFVGDLHLSKPIPKNMIVTGHIPHAQVKEYLALSDILVLPTTRALSYYKYTSPLKVFEYMASGVPILSTRIGSLKEILNDQNSFSFSFENIETGKEQIQYILSNSNESNARAIQAKQDVEHYTWEKRAQSIIVFLKNT